MTFPSTGYHPWHTGTSLQGSLVEAVPGHGREEVVLNLEVKASPEPVIEGLLPIADGCQLAADGGIGISGNLYDDVTHLCNPDKLVAL